MYKTLKYCPNCEEEREFDHGLCMECGEEMRSNNKVKVEEFDAEDEWTETDWGEDVEEVGQYGLPKT